MFTKTYTRSWNVVVLLVVLSYCAKLFEAKPIQLIKPSFDHTRLETVPEGIEFLRNVEAPIAVLSAVGAIHSGKSYLLNQLIDVRPKSDGFSVGYTVNPETAGLWVWSEPVTVRDTQILFIDTEGLFAHNVTDTYDAKLFAIATLLSSEIIYNTVKFIDSHHVDALELLIRRTNLFGLRAYAKQNHDTPNVSNLSTFLRLLVPNQLSWVVQDFVQDLGDRQAEDWLRELLEKSWKHSEDVSAATSFGTFFQRIDCVPLPVPAGDSETLQKLDQVDNSKLDPAYIRMISQLRKRLFERAIRSPKLKDTTGGRLSGDRSSGTGRYGGYSAMSGMDMANLLEFLVQAANSGDDPSKNQEGHPFPQLKSMAEQFTSLQLKLMKSDIVAIFDKDIKRTITEAYQTGKPLSRRELEREYGKGERQAATLWNATIRGLVSHQHPSGEVAEAEADFLAMMVSAKERMNKENCELVKTWCQKFVRTLVQEFEKRLSGVAQDPQLPLLVDASIEHLMVPIHHEFVLSSVSDKNSWAFGKEDKCCLASAGEFDEALKSVADGVRESNRRKIDELSGRIAKKVFDNWNKGLDKYRMNLQALGDQKLVEVFSYLKRLALKEFDTDMERFKELPEISQKKKDLLDVLERRGAEFRKQWEDKCKEEAQKLLSVQSSRYNYSLRRRVSLPALDDSIDEAIAAQSAEFKEEFDRVVFCHASEVGKAFWSKAVEIIEKATISLRQSNENTMIDISSQPLEELKKSLMADAENYYLLPKFESKARRLAYDVIFNALLNHPDLVLEADEANDSAGGGRIPEMSKQKIQDAADKFVRKDLEDAKLTVYCGLCWIIMTVTLYTAVLINTYRSIYRRSIRDTVRWSIPSAVLTAAILVPTGRQFSKQIISFLVSVLYKSVSGLLFWVIGSILVACVFHFMVLGYGPYPAGRQQHFYPNGEGIGSMFKQTDSPFSTRARHLARPGDYGDVSITQSPLYGGQYAASGATTTPATRIIQQDPVSKRYSGVVGDITGQDGSSVRYRPTGFFASGNIATEGGTNANAGTRSYFSG